MPPIRKASTLIMFILFFSLLPLGLYYIFRIDRKSYDNIISSRDQRLDQIVSHVNSDFAAYSQLLSTASITINDIPMNREAYENFLEDVFRSSVSRLFYGVGIWFQPYLFSEDERWFGPYISFAVPGREEAELTYRWSTAEYDYHSRSWYINSIQLSGNEIYISPPYFDTDYTYITFGKPFFINDQKYGVVTVDVVYPLLEDYFNRFDFSGFEGAYLVSTRGDIIFRKEVPLNRESERQESINISQILSEYRKRSGTPILHKAVSSDGVLTLYCISNRRKIIAQLIRENGYNYIVYFVFWTVLILMGLMMFSVQKKSFINRLLNHENDLLKHEIAKREKAEEQIRYLAYHDPASGLKNLNAFYEEVIPPVKETDHRAIILVSLDNFKALTALMDRGIIDHLLKAFSSRLIKSCPEGTLLYRGRGLSYYIVCSNSPVGTALILARQLSEEFKKSFHVHTKKLRIRVSIGIAYFNEAVNLEDVVNMAETAVAETSEKSGTAVRSFDRTLQDKLSRVLLLDTAMSQKGFLNELFLLYQPIIGIDSGEIEGMEALIRWKSPLFNSPVGPDEFIPIAEENGSIIDLGWFVIHNVLNLLSGILKDHKIFVSINVSPIQLIEMDFLSRLEELRKSFSVPKDRIKLEITESSGSTAVPYFWTIIQELIENGYKLAIDDFGTGESSFHRLYNMAFDTLKIDKTFVRNIHKDKRSLKIFKSLLDLSYSMNCTIIAEGIETDGEHETLKSIGVQYGQGYLYGKPVPIESIIEDMINKK